VTKVNVSWNNVDNVDNVDNAGYNFRRNQARNVLSKVLEERDLGSRTELRTECDILEEYINPSIGPS